MRRVGFQLSLWMAIGIAPLAYADKLPPLGQRLYEVPPVSSEAKLPTVKIVPSKDKKIPPSGFMRDPLLPGDQRQPVERPMVEQKAPPKPTYRESKLNFPAMAVDGRYTKPRVDFADRRLAVDHAEERLDFDFLDRLLETARRQEALLSAPAP